MGTSREPLEGTDSFRSSLVYYGRWSVQGMEIKRKHWNATKRIIAIYWECKKRTKRWKKAVVGFGIKYVIEQVQLEKKINILPLSPLLTIRARLSTASYSSAFTIAWIFSCFFASFCAFGVFANLLNDIIFWALNFHGITPTVHHTTSTDLEMRDLNK